MAQFEIVVGSLAPMRKPNPASSARALSLLSNNFVINRRRWIMVLVQHPGRPHAARLHPDVARILGMAGAIALNVALFMLLLVPMTTPVLPALEDVYQPTLPPIEKPKPPIPRVTVPVTSAQPRNTPTTARPVVPSMPIEEAVVDQGSLPANPPVDISAGTGPVDIAPTGPIPGVRLEYASAPAPAYPREALRDGLQGVVMLQVLVDTDGRPLEVNIYKSSGYRKLDEAARRQVLKYWTFRPAMQDGRAVQAIGLVPIDFNLGR